MTRGVQFPDAKGPPGMRLYAIGDVHGRLDLLAAMHALITAELNRDRPPDWRIIHLGDYVDRGPDSRGVLDLLTTRQDEDRRVLCLRGNHEAGLLDFLDMPDRRGLFAQFGGLQTAYSYGVRLALESSAEVIRSHAALLAAMPQKHRQFLSGLPYSVAFGDFFFCHAGIRPGVPLARQSPEDLIWIRDVFLNHPGPHEKVVVHGHTPTRVAQITAARVNLDTQAYHSGRLTALAIDGGEKRLLTVSEEEISRRL